MKQLVISSQLFPPCVVARARNALGRSLDVRSVVLSRERVTVMLATDQVMADDQVRLFKAALTAAAICHFSRGQRAPGRRSLASGEPRFHLSMELFGERFRVTLQPVPMHWPSVLRALSRLRLAAPVVESTDPVDRVILDLYLLEGGSVEEAIRELVGVLRAELTGPAA